MRRFFQLVLAAGSMAVFGLLLVAPHKALAAPVTFTSSTTIALTSPVVNLTVATSSVADSVTVNAGNIVVAMSASTGGNFVFTSPQAITSSGSGVTDTQTCSAGIQTNTITWTSGSASLTLTPSGSACNGTTVPGAPTIGTATAGDSQAHIFFTAPGSNGGSAITSYTVTSNPGGITVSGASSPITVIHLTNGTGYTFTVVATNAVGDSLPSSSSNSVTPGGTGGGGGYGGNSGTVFSSLNYQLQCHSRKRPDTVVLG